MRYVALLRGINVGGTNKVPMAELRDVFDTAGMQNVKSYINSGNVIFTSPQKSPRRLAGTLESAIERRFGFEVNVLVKSFAQMRSIAEAIPAEWVNDATMKCDVIYLWEDVDHASVLDELDFRPQLEDVRYTAGAVIWRIDRKNATRSRLPRIVGTPFYKRVTIRNCNTARKLVELMQD